MSWWQTFFSGLWLDVQRASFDDEATRNHVDLIERMLRLEPGARILDVPCGEGRISRELARRGYDVVGVDMTAELLDDARRAAAEENLRIEWRQGDMRDIDFDGEFDAVVCFWGSFGYFDEEGDARFARAAARALKPGGGFIIDTHVAESLFQIAAAHGWRRVGDIILLEERAFDIETGRMEVDWTFIRGAEQQTMHSSMRIYTYRELCQLLRAAGFTSFEGLDPHANAPFRLRSSRLVLAAWKMTTGQ